MAERKNHRDSKEHDGLLYALTCLYPTSLPA